MTVTDTEQHPRHACVCAELWGHRSKALPAGGHHLQGDRCLNNSPEARRPPQQAEGASAEEGEGAGSLCLRGLAVPPGTRVYPGLEGANRIFCLGSSLVTAMSIRYLKTAKNWLWSRLNRQGTDATGHHSPTSWKLLHVRTMTRGPVSRTAPPAPAHPPAGSRCGGGSCPASAPASF